MPLIARAEALVSALGSYERGFGPQIWLDPQLGLVGGVFPAATARFDFAAERAVALTEEPPASPSSTSASKRRVSLLHEAKRVGQTWEIETKDAIYTLGSATQTLIHGLDLLEEARPGTMEKLSHRKKQSKRPVARTRTALYDIEHPEAHSAKLKCGWFVATNNKSSEAQGILRQATELADLAWGKDFIARRT